MSVWKQTSGLKIQIYLSILVIRYLSDEVWHKIVSYCYNIDILSFSPP